MAKNIDPNLILIGDYLKISKEESFVIPEYQRGYSWNIIQCDKLWQDIEAFIDSGSADPYFFGTIIVDCSDTNKFSLIDGQQRTTTFILLLKALLIRIIEILNCMQKDEQSEALKDGLKDNRNKILDILYKTEAEERAELLKNWIKPEDFSLLENKSINEQYKNELKLIVSAKDFQEAESTCYKIYRKQKDNKYTNFFRNFKFFYTKLGEYQESMLNAFAKTFLGKCQIIEIRSWQIEQAITMFNSLNSTGMPLSDADIISAKLYSNAGEDKNAFNELWDKIIRQANALSLNKIINIDSVLQQYMYIVRSQTREYMKNGYPDVTTPGVRKYYTIMNENLLKSPLILCNEFDKIVQTWDLIKSFPIVKLALKFNENIKIYLISFLSRYKPEYIQPSIVLDIAECLIRLFAILELVDAGYSSRNFKTFLFRENVKLVDNSVSLQEIEDDFNNHIAENWNEDELKQSLLDYDKNILVFLNEYLYAKTKNLRFVFTESINVEHIMPSSGRNIEAIREDAGIIDKDEFDSLVNKLGNKILLEDDINKSIGRDWFQTKKQRSVNDKLGYKDSQYNIAKSLTEYPSNVWTKYDIEDKTKLIVDRITNFIFGR